MADKLLFIQIIAEIFRHQLHYIEIGSLYHDPLPVIPDPQQTHKVPQTGHSRSATASTARSFVYRDLGSLYIRQKTLDRRFIFSHLTACLLHEIVGKGKGKNCILLIDTADQFFPPGKAIEPLFNHPYQFIRIIQRTACLHGYIDIDTVGIHFLHPLHIQCDGKDEGDKQKNDRTENRHTRITHTGFQGNQINLDRTLGDRDLLVKDIVGITGRR